ncbi:hypothetical protein CO666_32710 [Rhizobium chutanense]|uniref:Uncharacterized protein n=1 Tax=Rhizobium chutanense TaxID=2035448 RepID=A0A2A6J1Q8_9HYPH|nr:hypothetical protein [Rhizobium chutanense]PDT00066.1 hypothetical protein CO666_32710 [Rhizobium chutanense]
MTSPHINSPLVGYSSIAAALAMLGLVNLALARNPVDISPMEIAKGTGKPASAERMSGVKPTDIGLDRQYMLSRPIFSPTRREFEPVAAPIAPQPEPIAPPPPVAISIPAFHLAGIRKIGADVSALLSVGTEDPPHWLPIGGMIEGWTLERVDTHSVALSSGDQVTVVDLYPPENPNVPQN